MSREADIQKVLNVRTLRRVMIAYSSDLKDYNRRKGTSLDSELNALAARLRNTRQAMRNRDGDKLYVRGQLFRQEVANITQCLTNICSRRKFSETVKVGKTEGFATYKKAARSYERAEVIFHVGHMWHRKVWQKLYQENRYQSPEYIILSAQEYRINVPHIRLYEVNAYGTAEKTTVQGWVGQTKMGHQYCSFRTDKKIAIQAAQKLTVIAIDQQLKEGTTNG